MSDYEYNWLECPACSKNLAFEGLIGSGAPMYQPVRCPDCGTHLGEIRADLGCNCLGDVGCQFSCTDPPRVE